MQANMEDTARTYKEVNALYWLIQKYKSVKDMTALYDLMLERRETNKRAFKAQQESNDFYSRLRPIFRACAWGEKLH